MNEYYSMCFLAALVTTESPVTNTSPVPCRDLSRGPTGFLLLLQNGSTKESTVSM